MKGINNLIKDYICPDVKNEISEDNLRKIMILKKEKIYIDILNL